MIGVIEAFDTVQVSAGAGQGDTELFRGAILGALAIGFALLTAHAALRRGAIAYSAAFMVGSAAVLELFWLGFLVPPMATMLVLIQGMFAASAIIFLTASIRAARNNSVLGGILFAASLVFVGVGIINLLGRADFSTAMRYSLGAIGGFAFIFSLIQSVRGDMGARLVLPGAVLVAAGIIIAFFGQSGGIMAHGLFASGVIAAGIVAIAERSLYGFIPTGGRMPGHATLADQPRFDRQAPVEPGLALASAAATGSKGAAPKASPEPAIAAPPEREDYDSRLMDVLDFSGICVWDWSRSGILQTPSLCAILGSDCNADFTPEAMRAFVSPGYLAQFEAEVLGHGTGDGGFDTMIVLHNHQSVRVRGARAVDRAGRLERVVALFELPQEPIPLVRAQAVPEQPDAGSGDAAPLSRPRSVSEAPQTLRLVARPIEALESREVIGFQIAESDDHGHHAGALPWQQDTIISAILGNVQALTACSLSDDPYGLSGYRERLAHQGSVASDLFVCLPITSADLLSPGVIDITLAAIDRLGIAPGSVVFDLVSIPPAKQADAVLSAVAALQRSGVRFAFADAGVSEADLTTLHRFRFEIIKLPAPLLEASREEKSAGQLVRRLVGFGRDAGVRVIAENIRSDIDREMAQNLGCAFGQAGGGKTAFTWRWPADGTAAVARPPAEPRGDDEETGISSTISAADESMSFDDWRIDRLRLNMPTETVGSTAQKTPASDLSGDRGSGTSIRNIEAAFAESVPSFEPGVGDARSSAERPKDRLPKWRTWRSDMR